MTDCERFLPDLKAYLDGELPPLARRRVRNHLRRCPSCREEMTLMEKITSELQQGDSAVLEPSLRDKLLAGAPSAPADSSLSTKPTFKERWRGTKRKPLIVWATASATLAAWFFLAPLFNAEKRGDAVKSEVAAATMAKESAAMAGGSTMKGESEMRKMMVAASPMADGNAPSAATRERVNENLKAMKQSNSESTAGDREMAMRKSLSINVARDVHRTANLSVEVKSAESASEAVEAMTKETKGGYIASNQLTTNDDGTKTANLTIKVPVNDFDSFISRVSKQGTVKSKNITGEDVTENISDASQERKSLAQQAEEARQNLQNARSLAQRSETSQAVRDLRVQIAQTEGRLELLKKSARLSDVTLELREKPKDAPVKTGGFLEQMKDTAQMAQENFVSAARVPILLLIWVVVYSPLWGLVLLAYRFVTRRSYTTPNS